MKKLNTKIIGIAVAATMLFASGSVLATDVQAPQGEQAAQGQTMADYNAEVAINSAGVTTNSTFYFTPLYDGEYSFEIVDPHFDADSMSPVVRVGERPMASTMILQAGRTYQITASVTSGSHIEWSWVWHDGYWTYYFGRPQWHNGYNERVMTRVYDEGSGVYGISIRFAAPEIEPEVEETVVVTVEGYQWSNWSLQPVYSEYEYQFTPETTGEYNVAISDVQSAWERSDGTHLEWNGGWLPSIVPNEPGEMTPSVSIYDGEDLIFNLVGEGVDVTKLDADVTYLVIATADHSGTYTLTITPVPAPEPAPEPAPASEPEVEVHYTEEELRAMATNNFVGTLYTRILGRFSDEAGRAAFADDLLNQGFTATQVAQIMFASEEFGNLAMDDATFVSCVYYTFCDREATADEAAAMMADLAAGTSRSAIVEQMAASDEWAAFCAYYGVNV